MVNPASMDISAPIDQEFSTAFLIRRLWREHVRHYRGRIILIVAATLIMSGTTADRLGFHHVRP
jgi:hypothetical protein